MILRRTCTHTLIAGALLVVGITGTQAAGALAVGVCGAYGFAIDFVGPDQAQTAALRKCSGKGCAVVASMKRNCAALAIDARNACGPFGYAAKPRLREGQNTALRQCYSHGGKECVIRAFICDAKG